MVCMQHDPDRYPLNMRILHWGMAVLIIGMLASGLLMDDLPRDTQLREQVYFLHKSCGVAVLLLALLRVIIRLFSVIPPLPDMITILEQKLAKLGHLALYLLMFAVPISGILMSNGYGYAVPFFGLELPRIIEPNRDLGKLAREAHEILPYALMGLIGLHVLGAIKHVVKERINLFRRII